MMATMVKAANALGGFLSPSEPQFMPPGLTLHINGTVRLGEKPEDSVADHNGKIWRSTTSTWAATECFLKPMPATRH